jgi:mannose-6-phosphate isomerase-like protein (cupin superfamily)
MEENVTGMNRTTLPTDVLKQTPSGPVLGLLLPLLGGEPAAGFKMSFWSLTPGLWTDWDQHDVLEVWLVAGGSGTVWREDDPTAVSVGDAVFMPSRTRHRLHNDGTEPMRLFSVWWPAPSTAGSDV